MKNVGVLSALVYTGISIIMVAVFLLATLPGHYSVIERIGGAAWVFILSMIILMPIVIPIVKKKIARASRPE
jgi:hypothetical protein